MKTKLFLFHGILLWLPSKIATMVLTVISLLATAGPAVDPVYIDTHIDPFPVRVAAVVTAGSGLAETKLGEIPDPGPPTTDGPWSEMISATPVGTVG